MSSLAIKVENLSKAYRLGQLDTGALSQDLERWWSLMRGKGDPFLRIGEENVRSKKGGSNIVWSLKDLNFDIEKGDVVGIIGRNGAGKSTLLKILSNVTSPTQGKIKMNGRVASLLEVGTGFHPELTGKENIYLNGAILGMTKYEINQQFDEIVDFSGVERYLDTPVKRYSSGMRVRLGFAVAAHLRSEILIVDEVLAVGDADFQAKCLGKMGDISKGDGRTILFVSHNMASIRRLCKNALLLNNGRIESMGDISEVTDTYISGSNGVSISLKDQIQSKTPDKDFKFCDVRFTQNGNTLQEAGLNGDDINIEIDFCIVNPIKDFRLYVDICDVDDNLLIRTFHDDLSKEISQIAAKGNYTFRLVIPGNFLAPIKYVFKIGATIFNVRSLTGGQNLIHKIELERTGVVNSARLNDVIRSKILPVFKWDLDT